MIILFNFDYYEYYYLNNSGRKHRLDGPSLKNLFGDKIWFKNGLWHRENGPAQEWYDGQKRYYLDGYPYPEREYWKIFRFKGYL